MIYNSQIKSFSNSSYRHIRDLSILLDSNLINIDKSNYNELNFDINKPKYDEYISNFIIVNSSKSNSEIISETIILDYKEQI